MTTDIFDFWSQVSPSDFIHPADTEAFRRLGPEGHGFNLKSLPGCFMGPLRTAPVVMLFMSPGFGPDDEAFAQTQEGVEWHIRQRTGCEALPTSDAPGTDWWMERTQCFRAPANLLASNLAVLNIGAYHSKEMTDVELLAALPSSRTCLDWAQGVLFPQAESGKRVVICSRAAKFWGLSRGNRYPGTLFAPPMTRGGHMKHGPEREQVIEAVRAVLRLN